MELARTNGTTDWHGIRKWFLDANKLDPEGAEPLMRFYQTYLYAGQQPTTNAVDGLLYAAALVPQDSKLRLMAVRQLLRDSNLAKAKSTFAPFAFSPHSKNAWNAVSAKAVAAMNDGNASEAAGQIERLQKLLEEDD